MIITFYFIESRPPLIEEEGTMNSVSLLVGSPDLFQYSGLNLLLV